MHPYLDGELDLVRSLEVEAHLKDCRTCARAYNELRSLHSAVSDTALHFQPPADLRNRVRSAIRDESPDESGATNRSSRLSWRWVIPALAGVVLIVPLSFLALQNRPSPSDLIAQEIVQPCALADGEAPDRRAIFGPAHRQAMVRRPARFFTTGKRFSFGWIQPGRRAT
jgi:anti-sigma factor RsiW